MARILIIDDDRDTRTALSVCIRLTPGLEGSSVIEVDNGATGEATCEALMPDLDLVLLDIRMGGLDGWETLEKIRLHFPDLPVIAITATSEPEELDRLRKVGFNDVVRKPFGPEKIRTAICPFLSCSSPVTAA
jgi:two-component system, OmpR family, response regulator